MGKSILLAKNEGKGGVGIATNDGNATPCNDRYGNFCRDPDDSRPDPRNPNVQINCEEVTPYTLTLSLSHSLTLSLS